MNISHSRFVCSVASLVLALGAAPVLVAQAPRVGIGPGAGPGPRAGFEGGLHGFGARTPVTGAPYSALRTTTHVETLANGSTVTHTSQVKEARDSNGKTYVETVPNATERGGAAHSFVRVFDPVNRETISWSANSKQATIVHLPEPGQFAGRRGQGAAGPAGTGRFRGNNQAATESLGSKTMNGIVVDGRGRRG